MSSTGTSHEISALPPQSVAVTERCCGDRGHVDGRHLVDSRSGVVVELCSAPVERFVSVGFYGEYGISLVGEGAFKNEASFCICYGTQIIVAGGCDFAPLTGSYCQLPCRLFP